MEALFLIILIGILSSLFGKRKTGGQTQRKKPFAMDRFGEIKTIMQSEKAKGTKTIQPELQQDQPVKQEVMEQYSQVKQEVADQLKSYAIAPNELNEEPVTAKEPPHTKVNRKADFLKETPDAQMVINGIIWSEILGEPRAKRPHFTRKR